MNAEIILSAAAAGLLSSVSPCQLPLYPVILNIISKGGKNRSYPVLAFALGHWLMYSLFFITLAYAIKTLEAGVVESLTETLYLAAYLVAGVLCIIFAIQAHGVVSVWLPSFAPKTTYSSGIFGAFTAGAIFSLVVSPCNLPYLIVVFLPLISSSVSILDGVTALLVFTLAITAPLVVVGLSAKKAVDWVGADRIRLASSVFLGAAGIYFLSVVASHLI